MPQTCPAQRYSRNDGFTFIEVVAALAIAAITVGAAAGAVSASGKLRSATAFQRDASGALIRLQSELYQLMEPSMTISPLTVKTGGEQPGWRMYAISDGRRSISTAFSVPVGTTR